MTYRKDTLPAIAGLVRGFNKRLGEKKYLLGLWYEEYGEDLKDLSETVLDLLWRLEYNKDAKRENLDSPFVKMSWSWAFPQCSIIYPFNQDEILGQYATPLWGRGANNVPRLPDDHAVERPWLNYMYTEASPTGLTMAGRLWETRLLPTKIYFSIKNTEDREYCYHLGAMSYNVLQERALCRPVQATQIRVEPPNEEKASGTTFDKMPLIAFYPDDLKTVCAGPIFCFPMAKFRHVPSKQDLDEKIIFVALIVEAVGHLATTEGYNPDLTSKPLSELVFRRLGLAYTVDGGWTNEHNKMVVKLPIMSVRIV